MIITKPPPLPSFPHTPMISFPLSIPAIELFYNNLSHLFFLLLITQLGQTNTTTRAVGWNNGGPIQNPSRHPIPLHFPSQHTPTPTYFYTKFSSVYTSPPHHTPRHATPLFPIFVNFSIHPSSPPSPFLSLSLSFLYQTPHRTICVITPQTPFDALKQRKKTQEISS